MQSLLTLGYNVFRALWLVSRVHLKVWGFIIVSAKVSSSRSYYVCHSHCSLGFYLAVALFDLLFVILESMGINDNNNYKG